MLFTPAGTVRVEGGARIAVVAVLQASTGQRYLVCWSSEVGRWVGINAGAPDAFDDLDLEYDIDGWFEEVGYR